MKLRLSCLLACLVLAAPLASARLHAQAAGNLENRMSASEFYAAGLNKLSKEELADLNAWLAAHAAPAAVPPAAPAEKVKVVDSSGEEVFPTRGKRETVETTIAGHFAGWTGANLVTLANGQQWQQVGDDHASCKASDNAAVKIRPSLFGNWLMDVDGCGSVVHVRRRR